MTANSLLHALKPARNLAVLAVLLLCLPALASATCTDVATCAASMTAGTWIQVPQNSTITDVVAPTGVCIAGIGNSLGDSSAGAYDPVRKIFHATGACHDSLAFYFYFDVASNNWTTTCPASGNGHDCTNDGGVRLPLMTISVGSGTSTGPDHTFTNVTFDSTTFSIGTAATFDVTVHNSGHTYTVAINNAGYNWYDKQVPGTITIKGSRLGGADGTNDLVISVDAVVVNQLFSHGYQFTAVDPVTGTVYYHQYGNFGNIVIWSKPVGSSAFTILYNGPESVSSLDGIAWWSRIMKGTTNPIGQAIPHGGGVGINRGAFDYMGADGVFSLYRPDLATYANVNYSGTNPTSIGNYPTAAIYNEALNAMFFGGGGSEPNSLWRMNFDQSSPTKLCDTPSRWSSQGEGEGWRLLSEPGLPKLLFIGNDDTSDNENDIMYEFDPAAPGSGCTGTYTLLTGDQVPPSTLGNPNSTISAALITAPLPDYDVDMFLSGIGGTVTLWLYKPLHALETFAEQCAHSEVVRCNKLGDIGEFVHYFSGSGPSYPIQPVGEFPINGCSPSCDYSNISRDTLTTINGDASLKITVPATSGADVGTYLINFADDFSVSFGASSEFYVQWRQWFSPDFLTNNWTGGEGFKQMSVSLGDPDNMTAEASCQPIDLPVQNVNNLGFPIAYQSCTGSTSHVAYAPLEDNFPYNCATLGGCTDIAYQDGRADPYCLYTHVGMGDLGSCFTYVPSEWLTFQEHVKMGPRGAGGLVDTFTVSGTPPGGCATTVSDLTQDSIVGDGTLAAFDITCSGGVYSAIIHDTDTTTGTRGSGYHTRGFSSLTILGTHFPGGATPANDVTIDIDNVLWNVVGAPPNDEFVNSYFELWMARDGQPSEPVIAWGPWGMSAGLPVDDQTIGKLWLTPYDTGRAATGFPVSSTNYGHVIISTAKIADPVAATFSPANTYYVRTGGSDAHACSSTNDDAHAKQTIAAGISCLSGGDTLVIGNGTYTESGFTDTVPSGSMGAPTTIKAANNRLAIIALSGSQTGFIFNAAASWIVFDGLKMTGGQTHIGFSGGALDTFSDIVIENGEFSDALHANPVSLTGCDRCSTINNYFHDIGDPSDSLMFGCAAHGLCPAVYYSNYSMNGTIQGNTFENITDYGLQIVVDISTLPDSFVVSGNIFHHIGWGGSSTPVEGGLFVEGTNHLIYNNLIYDTGHEGLVVNAVGSAGNMVIANNTTYSTHTNGGGGAIDNIAGVGASCYNNLLVSFTGSAIGGCPTASNNVTTGTAASHFVTPGSNFHLKTGSTAIGAGANRYSDFTTDADGAPRPPSAAWDTGALQYSTLTFTVQPSTTVAGSTMSPSVVVTHSSPVFAGSVTLTISGCGASASGTTVSATDAVATFPSLGMTGAGTGCTFTASTTDAADAVSSAFNVTAGVSVSGARGRLALRKR